MIAFNKKLILLIHTFHTHILICAKTVCITVIQVGTDLGMSLVQLLVSPMKQSGPQSQ